jgi:hypothetical protein
MPILDSKEITKYLNSDDYYFNLFDINYTENEKKTIKDFNIIKRHRFSHFGSYEKLLTKNTPGFGSACTYDNLAVSGGTERRVILNKFLSEIGNNNPKVVNNLEKIIIKMVKKVLQGYKTDYFWIDIRVTLPNNDFNKTRWHKDLNLFIKNSDDKTTKFATVLKGPGTLLLKPTKSINKIYRKIHDKQRLERKYKSQKEQIEINKKYRTIYAKEFDTKKIIQPGNNQGVIFYTGFDVNTMTGAIHSEPIMDEPRMFISITPNSKENIEELYETFHYGPK